ncbi:MAG TPA: hypothetical protein VH914_16855, partial [Acidimicrobiia bacterium]|nr:hypothetical protein [Acidimicrobiia bacterium]
MAKHHVLVDEYGNKARFVGDHLGQNRRGDDYYVKGDDDTRTLLHVDNRDGSWLAVTREQEVDVIRRLIAEGDRDLGTRVADALDRS